MHFVVFSRTFNLKEALNSIGVQTCAEVNKALKERGSPTLNAEVQANLVGQFTSLEEKDNPVCALMGEFFMFKPVSASVPVCSNLLYLTMFKCQSYFSITHSSKASSPLQIL